MDSCSQEKELGAQKLANYSCIIDRITGRKSQDLLSLDEHKHIIMCEMKTEISAIDKHKHVHVCAVLQIYNSVNCCV